MDGPHGEECGSEGRDDPVQRGARHQQVDDEHAQQREREQEESSRGLREVVHEGGHDGDDGQQRHALQEPSLQRGALHLGHGHGQEDCACREGEPPHYLHGLGALRAQEDTQKHQQGCEQHALPGRRPPQDPRVAEAQDDGEEDRQHLQAHEAHGLLVTREVETFHVVYQDHRSSIDRTTLSTAQLFSSPTRVLDSLF